MDENCLIKNRAELADAIRLEELSYLISSKPYNIREDLLDELEVSKHDQKLLVSWSDPDSKPTMVEYLEIQKSKGYHGRTIDEIEIWEQEIEEAVDVLGPRVVPSD